MTSQAESPSLKIPKYRALAHLFIYVMYICKIGRKLLSYSLVAPASYDITVLSAKSDSDVMFCYKVIRDLESIGHLFINPIHRIGLIHK